MARVWLAALRVTSWIALLTGLTLLTLPAWFIDPATDLLRDKILREAGGGVGVLALGVALVLLGSWLRRVLMGRQQADNDRLAQRIVAELRVDPAAVVPEYYLYLRAFETTGRLRVPLYLRLRKLSVGLWSLVTDDAESYVSTAIRRVAPLIALGRPGEIIGAGRATAEEESWQSDVLTLMRRAKAILLVPSSRPGTLWEIETLKREALWHKVVFIMPPRSRSEADTQTRWQTARQAMAAHGLEAPDHQPRGLLFEVGSDGKVTNVEPLLLDSAKQVRASMARILRPDPPKDGLFSAIAVADRRVRRATFRGWLETGRELLPYPLVLAGLMMPATTGVNPDDSWSTTLDRITTMQAISAYDDVELERLARSAPYLALEEPVPMEQLHAFRTGLLLRGLTRLGNDQLREYFSGLGEMLARVDQKTCAAISRGEIPPDSMAIALTYIPPDRIDAFLRARTDAILAEAEQRPAPAHEEVAAIGWQEFLNGLGLEGRERYERIDRSEERLSDEDACWVARTLYNSVTTLPEPHASAWARSLAALERGEGAADPTPQMTTTSHR